MNFDDSFSLLIGHEGGFTKDPADKGNWTSGVVGQGELRGTKFGISAAQYPHLDIENLTLDQAKSIYLSDYWEKALCSQFQDPLRFQLFDMAVNSGPRQAVVLLQRALGVPSDGMVGPKTLEAAAKAQNSMALTVLFLAARLRFMAGLSNWDSFSRGWAKRIASNLEEAVKWANC